MEARLIVSTCPAWQRVVLVQSLVLAVAIPLCESWRDAACVLLILCLQFTTLRPVLSFTTEAGAAAPVRMS